MKPMKQLYFHATPSLDGQVNNSHPEHEILTSMPATRLKGQVFICVNLHPATIRFDSNKPAKRNIRYKRYRTVER